VTASPEPMYSVAQIARAWGVSNNHVYALIKSGELPAVDLGHGRVKKRVLESALNAYLDRLKEQARRGRTPDIRGHLKVVAAA
jgi:excisionase family DNA binding protein